MEHVRQGSLEHTPGAFNVAKDVACLATAADHDSVLCLPVSDSTEEIVPVYDCLNPGNLKKYLSQPTSVGCPGRSTAPGQALPLYMDQASLYHDVRPDLTDCLDYIGVPVHGEAMRLQPLRNRALKECQQLIARAFRDIILSSNKPVSTSIHQSNKATWAVQESTVEYKILALIRCQYRKWYSFFQLVIYHTIKLSLAVTILARYLSY